MERPSLQLGSLCESPDTQILTAPWHRPSISEDTEGLVDDRVTRDKELSPHEERRRRLPGNEEAFMLEFLAAR
jgi:hypothetical protein